MRLTKGILVLTRCCVEGAVQVGLVKQFVVQVEPDVVFVPVHPPDVKFISPLRILLQKVAEWHRFAVPVGLPATVRTPGCVGQDVGHTLYAVVFHDVDFAAGGPLHGGSQGPDGRPGASGCGDFRPDFKPTVLEGLFAFGLDGGSRILGGRAALTPVAAVGVVVGIVHGFQFAHDG